MKALILIDLQNDFMPGGALAVPGGDEAAAAANRLARRFEHVVATQDWHPPDHLSFASQHPGKSPGDVVDLDGLQQTLWPDHCVQGTTGAALHRGLDAGRLDAVIRKGSDRLLDSYSAFFDNARRRATGLHKHLKSAGIDEIYLVGLAADYCVKFSALDAVGLGWRTHAIREGCSGIDLEPGDVSRAWTEMAAAGVDIVSENAL